MSDSRCADFWALFTADTATWGAPLVLAKSTKGFFAGTDWSDASERSKVLETLIELVTRCVVIVQDGIGTHEVRKNKRLPLTRQLSSSPGCQRTARSQVN